MTAREDEGSSSTAGALPWSRRDTLAVCGLGLACLILFAWGLGSYPLWDPWESMHAETMLEMGERGDWVTPWLDGRASTSQPILMYWAMAGPTLIWGSGELAARLPSALAAVGGVLLLFYCVRRLRGFNTALVAAAVLATLPLYYYMARQAMPDMLLTAFLTGTMGFFALARFQVVRRRLHLRLFYACLALALLAKGPLALALTGGALLIFGVFHAGTDFGSAPGGWWSGLRRLAVQYEVGTGALLALVIAGPWHLAQLFKHGPGFATDFFLNDSLSYFRGAAGVGGGTAEFYARDLVHGMYPWVSLLPLALLCLFHGKTRFDEDAAQKWYFVAWGTTVFALFTLAGSKLDHYLLPVTPALAVLVALFFEAWFRERAPFWVGPGLLISIAFALLPIRDFLVEGDRYMLRVFTDSPNLDHPGLGTGLKVFLAAWIVVMLAAVVRRRSWIVVGLAVAVTYGHALYMTQGVLPDHSADHTLRGYTDLFERVREPDAELLLFGRTAYSAHYYVGRERLRHFPVQAAGELADRASGKPHVYIIAESDEWGRLSSALRKSGATRWLPIANDHPRYVMLTNSLAARRAR